MLPPAPETVDIWRAPLPDIRPATAPAGPPVGSPGAAVSARSLPETAPESADRGIIALLEAAGADNG